VCEPGPKTRSTTHSKSLQGLTCFNSGVSLSVS
jgi:hypothetical protein